MSWTADLLDGLARQLAEAGLATYRPNGTYAKGDTALAVAVMPPAPDRVICLAVYNQADPLGLADVEVSLQIRCRATADPRAVDALADPVVDLLHGATRLVLGGVRVSVIRRISSAPLGADALGRMERTDNYLLRSERPTGHRPD